MKFLDPLLLWSAFVVGIALIVYGAFDVCVDLDSAITNIFRGHVILLLGGIWQQVYKGDNPKPDNHA